MKAFIDTFLRILTVVLDSGAAWFFCCIVSAVIFPIVLERIIFYIPKLIMLSRNNEVYYKSVLFTVLEVVLWVGIPLVVYCYLYYFQNRLFVLSTTSIPALVAWIISILYIFRRLTNFDRTIKRDFYYDIYMRYIKPEALSEYMNFIEELDTLELDKLKELANQPIKYMHKQAVLRKLKEVSMS